jgi:hypothetical protein
MRYRDQCTGRSCYFLLRMCPIEAAIDAITARWKHDFA